MGPLVTFVIFAIQASVSGSDRLSASQTFSSLSVIGLMTSPAEAFLQSLPLIGMATGCLDRIQEFLTADSCDDQRIISQPDNLQIPIEGHEGIEVQTYGVLSAEPAVALRNASVRPSSSASLAVRNVNLDFVKSSLTMVVGVVGSGKSTLLKAIIGELKCESGSISVAATNAAYCSQTPWLQNTTVRRIVCGYSDSVDDDPQWYSSVLHACAFDRDVLELPDQHDTIIGSRGVTLSGGQKQRLVCHPSPESVQ